MDVTPAPMTTAQATVAALLAHGITAVYALPGVHNDPLFDALFAERDRIRTVHTRHGIEQPLAHAQRRDHHLLRARDTHDIFQHQRSVGEKRSACVRDHLNARQRFGVDPMHELREIQRLACRHAEPLESVGKRRLDVSQRKPRHERQQYCVQQPDQCKHHKKGDDPKSEVASIPHQR